MEKCETCEYFEEKKKECRLFSPTVVFDGEILISVFPTVQPDTWCGAHYPKEDNDGKK